MTRFAEVIHALDIVAPINKVRSQFADLDHHISTNVHPKLSFQVLEKRADGFNKGGSLDFQFTPAGEATRVQIAIRLPLPPLMGFLKPLLISQIRREVTAAALEDKYDLEVRGYPGR